MNIETNVSRQYQKHILLLQVLARLLLLFAWLPMLLFIPVQGNRLSFFTRSSALTAFILFMPLTLYGYSLCPWVYVIDDSSICITNKDAGNQFYLVKKFSLAVLKENQSIYTVRRITWKGMPALALLIGQERKPPKRLLLVYEPEDQEKVDTDVLPKLY